MNDKHTKSYLRTLLIYDASTGLFQWRHSGRGKRRGWFAGTPVKRGAKYSEIGETPTPHQYSTPYASNKAGTLTTIQTHDEYIIVDGYRLIVEGENYTAHELAWFLMHGEWTRVCHRDGRSEEHTSELQSH